VQPEPPEEQPPSSGSWFRWLLPARPDISHALPALGYRDFRIFWLGQLVSLTGTWVQSVAQQWLVLKLTGSAFALGLVTTVQFTPLLLLALLGGAVSDRVSKRDLLLTTQVVSGLLALLLGVLVQTGVVQYWHVLLIALTLGTVNAFYVPARQAFVPELVDRQSLLNAVALNSAIFNGARVIGPAVGGILIAVIGLALNFYLNAASYLAVIVGLLMIRPRREARDVERQNIWREVGDGLRFIAASPTVYTILALVGAASLFGLNFTTLLPLVARFVLNVGSSGYGFLAAALGAGSLVGAITLAFLRDRRHVRTFIYAGALTFAAAEIGVAVSRSYLLSISLLVVVGVASTLFTTTANTRVLSLTPAHLQGRVMSVYSLMFLGMTPFGSLLSGVVAERFGAPVAMAAGAAITLVFTVAVYFLRRAQRAREALVAASQSGST
jgi:MFS family permease